MKPKKKIGHNHQFAQSKKKKRGGASDLVTTHQNIWNVLRFNGEKFFVSDHSFKKFQSY